MNEKQPVCWIIAGPNGAGKTTFAMKYLPNVAGCRHFVNADLIAAGMAPLAPETERMAAGRIFLKEIERHIEARHDFGFETTLAGRAYLRMIQRLKAEHWRIELIYLALTSPEMARLRVSERVAHGGHDIPAADIDRRFGRSLRNLFEYYVPAVDRTFCFLNRAELPEPIFVQQDGSRKVIRDDMLELLTNWVDR